MNPPLSPQLFALDAGIRYVAVNQKGQLLEMVQNPNLPSYNPTETDRMEELIVNPVAVELTRRRGELDLGGLRYLLIRYGMQFQLVVPWQSGHVSVGIEANANATAIAERVVTLLQTRGVESPRAG